MDLFKFTRIKVEAQPLNVLGRAEFRTSDESLFQVDLAGPGAALWMETLAEAANRRLPVAMSIDGATANLKWAVLGERRRLSSLRQIESHYWASFSGSHSAHRLDARDKREQRIIQILETALRKNVPVEFALDPVSGGILDAELSEEGDPYDGDELGPEVDADLVLGATGTIEHPTTWERILEQFHASQNDVVTFPWAWRVNCCESRAAVMRQLFRSRGLDCQKVYAQPHDRCLLDFDPQSKVGWQYHIAPAMACRQNGSIALYVIDPSTCTKPVSRNEWLSKFPEYPNPKQKPAIVWTIAGKYYRPTDRLLGLPHPENHTFMVRDFRQEDYADARQNLKDHFRKLDARRMLEPQYQTGLLS